ncbi:MAG: hypothetical protein QHI48_06980 [Bacteroidota bacterium]|nr:hypothetical protein [Bacteroidota bacterium]
MKRMKLFRTTMGAFLSILPIVLPAQEEGRIVFKDPKSEENRILGEDALHPRTHATGMGLMIGNDGFGISGFYHHAFSEVVAAFADISFSEACDVRQIDYYDYWTGEQYSPNKINRVFRVPLFIGVQYRLFKDDLADNFRPFLQAGAGPVLLYITPADMEFFTSLGHGYTDFTYGGYLGAGAYFGFDRASVFGLNLRYLIIPTPSGIQSVRQGELPNANGFFIGIQLGAAF